VFTRLSRFAKAMLAYAALGVLAALTLDDSRIRGAVLILLAGLAVLTWNTQRKQQ
jgi:xanthine/uracil/vitamin C permease (AzgA family)